MKFKIDKNYSKCPNRLTTRNDLALDERMVLVYLLKFDECFAGQRKIAEDLNTSRATIHRIIQRLLKMNVISKRNRERWSVIYSVNAPSVWTLEPKQKKKPRKGSE